jgi:hypothetical protein
MLRQVNNKLLHLVGLLSPHFVSRYLAVYAKEQVITEDMAK